MHDEEFKSSRKAFPFPLGAACTTTFCLRFGDILNEGGLASIFMMMSLLISNNFNFI